MFSKGLSSYRVGCMHTQAHAHALAIGAKFNPEQGLGQIELPGVFESHIQAAKQ